LTHFGEPSAILVDGWLLSAYAPAQFHCNQLSLGRVAITAMAIEYTKL
jgi:hypothetical protein